MQHIQEQSVANKTNAIFLDTASESALAKRALDVLQETFGYRDFRGEQKKIIHHIIQGNHALVLMPTGGGKSLCYQIPALIRSGLTIVVSPLIALMQNQVLALRKLGIKAACLNAFTSTKATEMIFQSIKQDELKLLYMAPERLLVDHFLDFLDGTTLGLFAIDEAHCVSQWGQYFRPEYRQLSLLPRRYPDVPRVALTATADEKTCEEILHYLDLNDAQKFTTSFNRPNLFYQIVEKKEAKKQLVRFIKNGLMDFSGIVYCLSRKKVESVTHWLRSVDIQALPYHAGLDRQERENNQKEFLYEDNRVMVATVAFGMGIDKPDIRFVAHLDMPRSLENFYQESGRAGRDDLPAISWLCYGLNDFVQLKTMIMGSQSPHSLKDKDLDRLEAVLAFCEGTSCRRQHLLQYFEETIEACGYCDNCLKPATLFDATVACQKLLSCIYRTKQQLAAGPIVDILRGKSTALIHASSWERLSTYGIGADRSEAAWRSLIRQLIVQGLLDVNVENQALVLTDKSRPLLRGALSILAKEPLLSKSSQEVRRYGLWLRSEHQDRLWHALKTWRASVAAADNVPTYVIFSDRTLQELVENQPKNEKTLSQINGIGRVKLLQYGPTLLRILASHSC